MYATFLSPLVFVISLIAELCLAKRPHQHMFVTTLDDVASPTFSWCRLCREKLPLVAAAHSNSQVVCWSRARLFVLIDVLRVRRSLSDLHCSGSTRRPCIKTLNKARRGG